MIGTLRDLDVDGLVNAMPTFTNAGRESLKKRLSEPLSNPLELQKRQQQIKAIKPHATKVTELRKQLQATEDDVRSVADASSDKRHAEYY